VSGRDYRDYVNPVVRNMPPSGIRRFFDLASEMSGVISLGVGEPDFVTPWHVRESCIWALEKGYTMYTSNQGLLELRTEIAGHLEGRYGLRYDPKKEILVTVGSSEALDLALRALVVPGDEVVIPEPCYVSYGPATLFSGGVPVYVGTGVTDGFQVTASRVEKVLTPRSKVLLLCYPNNPTGAVMEKKNLWELAELAAAKDLIVISDEIYDSLVYGVSHLPLAGLPGLRDRTVLINGLSKAYAMTGWRLGYAAGNAAFIEAMTKIHQYTMLCAPITAQMAAIEALRNGTGSVARMVREYDRRRRLVVRSFNEMGLYCFEPKGAFYAFPDVSSTGLSGAEFAERLLVEEKVAVVPGGAFGPSGEGFVRCAYAASLEDLAEALKRIARFVGRLRRPAAPVGLGALGQA